MENRDKRQKAYLKTTCGKASDETASWKLLHPVIETHFHLDYLKQASQTEILEEAQRIGVEKLITISVSAENIGHVVPLAEQHANLFTTQGIHPHHAKDWSPDVEAIIKKNVVHPKVVAIGEIGLDYFYKHSSVEEQKKVFHRQLELAIEFDLPVVIHSRDADEDTIEVMQSHVADLKRKGVIHSFTSGMGLLEFALKNDFCIGFNGIITFKNAENVREALRQTPPPQLLLETDAPFLTPAPFRGMENAPFYLPFVAETIAVNKQMAPYDLLKQIHHNSEKLFYKL